MTRAALLLAFVLGTAGVGSAAASTFEITAKPGANYDIAQFRMWLPDASGPVRAVVVLVPGSNGDGRAQADDPAWQAFATSHHLALVACYLKDKPHDQSFIEEYVDVSKGSGQALLDSLSGLASQANHSEIASAPLMLWGMSAGGEFDYEFAAWKPERVIAFVVNKGNIYYTALAPLATRKIPALFFTGEKDLDFRVQTVTGIFAVNRRGGALWGLTPEPGIGHEVGRSKDLGMMLFEDVLDKRLPDAGGGALRPLAEKDGYLGEIAGKTIAPVADGRPPNHTTAWLPTERLAKAWLTAVTTPPPGK